MMETHITTGTSEGIRALFHGFLRNATIATNLPFAGGQLRIHRHCACARESSPPHCKRALTNHSSSMNMERVLRQHTGMHRRSAAHACQATPLRAPVTFRPIHSRPPIEIPAVLATAGTAQVLHEHPACEHNDALMHGLAAHGHSRLCTLSTVIMHNHGFSAQTVVGYTIDLNPLEVDACGAEPRGLGRASRPCALTCADLLCCGGSACGSTAHVAACWRAAELRGRAAADAVPTVEHSGEFTGAERVRGG